MISPFVVCLRRNARAKRSATHETDGEQDNVNQLPQPSERR
jgi:hypothetical protein